MTVNFAQDSYTVAEGGSVAVTVTLDDDPERQVVIPLTRTNEDGAGNSDYSGVPANLTFDSGDTQKTFTFTANERRRTTTTVSASRSELRHLAARWRAAGTTRETVISITDDDVPSVSDHQFRAGQLTRWRRVTAVTVTVDPGRRRRSVRSSSRLTRTNEGGASDSDYSGVPANLTFAASDTERTFTFTATDDTTDDDGESVKVTFGSTLPTGVSEGSLQRSDRRDYRR